jgi:hypothetical protein
MSACAPITFSNISPLKYRAIVARIRAQADSTAMNGNTGSATGQSPLGQFAAEWTYDGTAKLTITVTRKPMLVTENFMIAKMQALVDSISV